VVVDASDAEETRCCALDYYCCCYWYSQNNRSAVARTVVDSLLAAVRTVLIAVWEIDCIITTHHMHMMKTNTS